MLIHRNAHDDEQATEAEGRMLSLLKVILIRIFTLDVNKKINYSITESQSLPLIAEGKNNCIVPWRRAGIWC